MTLLSTCSRCGRAIFVVAAVGLAAVPHPDKCVPDPSGVYCMQPARDLPHTHGHGPSNQQPTRSGTVVNSTASVGTSSAPVVWWTTGSSGST
jgi:hypothetical protein